MRPLIGAVDPDQFAAGMFGLCVERATANLPQTTNSPIFNIIVGRVSILSLVGVVTTIIQAQATLTKLTSVPGNGGTSVDLCTTTDITGLEVGGMISPGLAASAALQKQGSGGIFNAYGFFTAAIGTINLNCAASSTGQIRWTCFYVPFDPGAAMTAA